MIDITDLTAAGWRPPAPADARAKACCEQLERGGILVLRDSSLLLSAADRDILTQVPPDVLAQKNIAYQPASGGLRGLRRGVAADAIRHAMAAYSQCVIALCTALLAPYARAWRVELTSFRPLEEQGRRLPHRQRNDLLHIDSFPARPTNGARILRCFTNIHPTRPRIWTTSSPLATLSTQMLAANLAEIDRRARSPRRRLFRLARAFFDAAPAAGSPYDQFMLSLHDRMKADTRYGAEAPRFTREFPPGATWLLFTDAVPHAVMEGQYALEQTFFVPREVLLLPDEAPVALIERLAGRCLTA